MSNDNLEGIAIIGMAGRFPGAKNIDEFWSNLCAGRHCITTFLEDETLDPRLPRDLINHPDYVKARGIIDDVDRFDAAFFGINAREAEIMDPQHRIFLELAWHALEHAGYNPDNFKGLIGVFAGMGNNTYYTSNVINHPEKIEAFTPFQAMLANEKDFLATRVSFKLNLTGPSLSIYTACSTSLVTICHACDSLLAYQCDMALAGGISIFTPQNSGYLHQAGMIASKDGICRPFDAGANGTIFGNGGGIVVLKRLEDAIEDRDRIIAVIRGTAVNNDGSDKVSFTAPSVKGQTEVIMMAMSNAGVSPDSISFVEAHGTGTPIGDPLEIEALTQAFGSGQKERGYCAIGSVKGNVGHLDSASGVAGFIKAAMALNKGQLPPSIHFKSPNPEIDFDQSPFFVNTTLLSLPAQREPHRAGVSSFGIGGTNAHAILETAPKPVEKKNDARMQLIVLSAKTRQTLEHQRTNLAAFLAEHPDTDIADTTYTLQVGRKSFAHRGMLICADGPDAVEALSSKDPARYHVGSVPAKKPEVVFMFPGQGAQYINMGRSLYEAVPEFRNTIDDCAQRLMSIIGEDLTEILFPDDHNASEATERLRQTRYNQPALFVVEYALARLWQLWGVTPYAMIGHSVGEFVAATLAGVFSMEDALLLVAERGRLMQAQTRGTMITVAAPADKVNPLISNGLSIAAINAPALCVVSGENDLIEAATAVLDEERIAWRRLQTSHAYHSQMMEPVVEPFSKIVASVKRNPPEKPYVSTVTGHWIKPQQAIDPSFWAEQLRKPVLFSAGFETLKAGLQNVYLEVGPGRTAAVLAALHTGENARINSFSSLMQQSESGDEWGALLNAIGRLWLSGVDIDWGEVNRHRKCLKLPLPLYPFDKKRFWLDTGPASAIYTCCDTVVPNHGDASDVSRIEQIENATKEHHAILHCAAITSPDDAVAVYYTTQTEFSITSTELRTHILDRIGADERISGVFELSELPRNVHGDIDRQRLFERLTPRLRRKDYQEDLESESERLLAGIWKEALDIDYVKAIDNFYELGGNSLLSIQVISQVKQLTGIELKPETLLLDTLRQIAASYLIPAGRSSDTNKAIQRRTDHLHDEHHFDGPRMELFFFGSSDHQLMSAYYPACLENKKDHGVLLCYPIGHEYMRSHWAFRQLSNLLSRAGFDVMRFDYYATGDSAGDSRQGDVDIWTANIVAAAEELKIISGTDNLSAVGLRFGASLAYRAAISGLSLQNLVLWDPVVDGQIYLDKLEAMHSARFPVKTKDLDHQRCDEILGFPYSTELKQKIGFVKLSEKAFLEAERLIIISAPKNATVSDRIGASENDHLAKISKIVDDAGDWDDCIRFDQALVVNKVLNEIVGALNDSAGLLFDGRMN